MSDPFGADPTDFDYNATFGAIDPNAAAQPPVSLEHFGVDDGEYQQIDANAFHFDPTQGPAQVSAMPSMPTMALPTEMAPPQATPAIPASQPAPPPAPLPQASIPTPTPESPSGPDALAEFMSRWEAKLSEKDKDQQAVGQQAKVKAKGELESFYVEREHMKESKQAKNRQEEQALLERLEAELESDNPWARVLGLVDVDTKAKKEENKTDLSRMKSVFIQLKNDPIKIKG